MLGRRTTAPRLLAVLAVFGSLAAGCSDEAAEDPVGPGPLARPDAGATPGIQGLPVLTPCPNGWDEQTEEGGLSTCEPWPGSSPVAWPCPSDWVAEAVDGVDTCVPGPSWGPVQWACPPGWRSVRDLDDEITTCEPFPLDESEPCAPLEAHRPGEAACTPIGSACPSGDFPEGLPSDRHVVYVRPGAAGGDGSSPSTPFASLADVPFDALPAGAIVAIAKGTYTATVVLDRSVTLWGACPESTVLTDPGESSARALVTAIGPGEPAIVLRDLRLSGADRRGVEAAETAQIRLEGVVIEGVRSAGLSAYGSAVVTLDDVLIAATRASPNGAGGRGVGVEEAARVVARRAILRQNVEAGAVVVGTAARLVLEDSLVIDTESLPNGSFGIGVVLVRGRVELIRTLIARNRDTGIFADGREAALLVEDAIVRDHRPAPDGAPGRGLEASGGAQVEVRRTLFSGNRELGVAALGQGTQVSLEDVVIRDTESRQDGRFGRGLALREGSWVQAHRLALTRNRDAAISVETPGTRLVLEDARVTGTRRAAAGAFDPNGVSVLEGGVAEIERIVLKNNLGSALTVQQGLPEAKSLLQVSDAVIRGTRGDDVRESAAVYALGSGRIELRRARLEDNESWSIYGLGQGAELILEDALVTGTRPESATGRWGRGVDLQLGAQAELRRMVFANNHDVALILWSPQTRLILEDAIIRDTASEIEDRRGGRGLSLYEASAEVRRALFERNREVAILVSDPGARLHLEDAVVRATGPQESEQALGRGLQVQDQASAFVSRTRIIDNLDIGIMTSRASTATLTDVLVDGILRPVCEPDLPSCSGAGAGFASYQGLARLERALVRRAEACGLLVWAGSEVDVASALFERNEIGACFEDPLYDTGRVAASFAENGEDIQFLNVPPPPAQIGRPDFFSRSN